MSTGNEAPCPDCGGSIDLGRSPGLGHRLSCLNCHAYLEIIHLKPAGVALSSSIFGLACGHRRWERGNWERGSAEASTTEPQQHEVLLQRTPCGALPAREDG